MEIILEWYCNKGQYFQTRNGVKFVTARELKFHHILNHLMDVSIWLNCKKKMFVDTNNLSFHLKWWFSAYAVSTKFYVPYILFFPLNILKGQSKKAKKRSLPNIKKTQIIMLYDNCDIDYFHNYVYINKIIYKRSRDQHIVSDSFKSRIHHTANQGMV